MTLRRVITHIRLGLASLALLGLVLSLLASAPCLAQRPRAPGDDLICGPRCLQQALAHFGQETDLIELARETQWPNLEAGASMASLDQALRKRGLHTAAIQMPPGATLLWPHPAIVHTRPVIEGELGHYVLWLPSSTAERVEYWSGLGGVAYAPAGEFWTRSSGAVLVTSAAPIDRLEDLITGVRRTNHWIALLAIGIVPAVVWMLACDKTERFWLSMV